MGVGTVIGEAPKPISSIGIDAAVVSGGTVVVMTVVTAVAVCETVVAVVSVADVVGGAVLAAVVSGGTVVVIGALVKIAVGSEAAVASADVTEVCAGSAAEADVGADGVVLVAVSDIAVVDAAADDDCVRSVRLAVLAAVPECVAAEEAGGCVVPRVAWVKAGASGEEEENAHPPKTSRNTAISSSFAAEKFCFKRMHLLVRHGAFSAGLRDWRQTAALRQYR